MEIKNAPGTPAAKLANKYTVLVLLLATVALFLMIWTKPVNQAELKPSPVLRVAAGTVLQQAVQPVVTVSGYIRPAHKSALRFEVAGQVRQRLVEPGQGVRQGQTLLTLAQDDFLDNVAEARAQLAEERAAVERDKQLLSFTEQNRQLQEKEVRRLQQLGQGSMASKSHLDAAQQQLLQLRSSEEQLKFSVDTAQARLAMKKSRLRRSERNLERTQLSSPFDAVINDVLVQEGDYVTASQVVLEVIQGNESDLYLEVRGDVAAALTLGQTVAVTLDEQSYRAEIIALQREPDPETFTHALRLRIRGKSFLPGTIGYASLPLTPLESAITVPVSAVLYDADNVYVFRIEQDHVVRTPVRLGMRVDNIQVIRSGLSAGESIVVQDVAILSDGQRIESSQPGAGMP